MRLFDQEIPDDCYVVIAENDSPPKNHIAYGNPLVFETYLKCATLQEARKRISYLNGSYGRTRIAKLTFIEEDTHE